MSEINVLAIVEAILQLSMIIMVGLYFTFSNTLMRVLTKSRDGATTMIEINKQILNPLFLTCFGLSGLAGLYFCFFHSGFQSLAGIVFLIGTTLVTVFFNVPLNEKLKNAPSEKLASIWRTYLHKWVFWNHLRTGCAVLSGLLLSI